MIYLYAIAEPADLRVDILGLADQLVQSRHVHDLSVIASEHAGPIIRPTADNILRHERVIERVMQDCAILPARFGTTFASADVLAATIENNRDALRAGLEKVRGCIELGVRVMWREAPAIPSPPEAISGAEYMRQRAQQEREREDRLARARALSDSIYESLSEHAIRANRKPLDDSPFVLTAAYLVRPDRIEEFRRRVEDISNRSSDARTLCTGPWPPYHFVPELRPAEVCRA